MPGPTETEFFERADMMDTKVGQMSKDDPADVAKTGFDAMMRGDGDVVAGWKNKLKTSIATVMPAGLLAEQHRKLAQPGYTQNSGSGSALPALAMGAAALLAIGWLIFSQDTAHAHRGPHRRSRSR
jgi:hypothetical protein